MEKISTRAYHYPMAIEREYLNFLLRQIKKTVPYFDNIIDIYKSRRRYDDDDDDDGDDDDSDSGDSDDELEDILGMFIVSGIIKKSLDRIFSSMNSTVRADFMKEAANALKGTVKLFELQAQQYNANEIMDLRDSFISENTELITNMADEYKHRIRAAIIENIDRGGTADELAASLSKIEGMTKRRAELIAVDQIGKLHGKMQEFYQRSAGVKKYRWRTKRDNRVRPEHAAREGKIFRWDSPPPDGHPGMAIRCRCKAQPVFEDNDD